MSKTVRVFIRDGDVCAIKTNVPESDVVVEVINYDTNNGDKEAFEKLLNAPEYTDYENGTVIRPEGIDGLIPLMEEKGYYYDHLESYEGYYRFTYTGMVMPLTFASLQEIRDWLEGDCD